MSRKIIAAILAAAITVTAFSAAPARAMSEGDVAKLVFGAAALFVLSRALDDDGPSVSTSSPQPVYRPVQPRPLPDRVSRHRLLPAECLRRHETRNGTVRMLGQRCMNKTYRHVNRLPSKCQVTAYTRQGVRHGYKPRCLRNHGYKLAQR